MIFDASSIYTAIENNSLDKLLEGKTLDLAMYELGNVVWKGIKRNTITPDEGEQLIVLISKIISIMEIQEIGVNGDVLKVAVDNNLSYYDASYLYAAISVKDVLVTEDKKLKDKAAECGVETYGIEEVAKDK
jgi:predicted nucleic acid-binding protein